MPYSVFIFILVLKFTQHLDTETYNQTVKVSACEGIDRYMYT